MTIRSLKGMKNSVGKVENVSYHNAFNGILFQGR